MNTNISAERIMVFGDSLSWGDRPGSKHQRLDTQTRWPSRLQMLLGATEKSKALVGVYGRLATKLGIGFVALGSIVAGVDGIHIDAAHHAKLAELVYTTLSN